MIYIKGTSKIEFDVVDVLHDQSSKSIGGKFSSLSEYYSSVCSLEIVLSSNHFVQL